MEWNRKVNPVTNSIPTVKFRHSPDLNGATKAA